MLATEWIAELQQQGLCLRGVLPPQAGDDWPPLPSGEPAHLWLVGTVGSAMWKPFSSSTEHQDGHSDPLDRWSRRLAENWAERLGGLALFPFGGPPHWPFQRWADRAESLSPSPLGLRLHPEHGLWHAYRFALLLPQRIAAPAPLQPPEQSSEPPCTRCPTLCVKACPVGAHDHGFDLQRCVDHLRTPEGQTCLQNGCQARAACPEGAASRYASEQTVFHMRAFVQGHGEKFKLRRGTSSA